MNKEKELDSIIIKYEAALKVLETQMDIINSDFKYIKKYNPIEHVKTRIKSYDSIIKKLESDNIPFSLENVEKYVNDIVGLRIICSFPSDVYELIDIIRNSDLIKVIHEKDYISNPKSSGYRSYHLIVEVPVELINNKYVVKAEIQIRTLAMDLWASLNHKLVYKADYSSAYIDGKLRMIGDELNSIDNEMTELFDLQTKIREKFQD
jgi:putative GTP pyrophosphokinase